MAGDQENGKLHGKMIFDQSENREGGGGFKKKGNYE